MGKILILFIMMTPFNLYSQINVDDVGEGWKENINLSLMVIEKYDKDKFNQLVDVCKTITFYTGKYSTIEGSNAIVISQLEMLNFNVNNVSSIIVHESMHLFFKQNNITHPQNVEERLCYEYELEFLEKIHQVEPWLIHHAKNMIQYYSN